MSLFSKSSLSLLLISGLMIVKSWAIIGENLEQSDLRYGTPASSHVYNGSLTKYYQKNGFVISAEFIVGVCESITYEKKNSVDFNSPLSDIPSFDREQLLNNNASGWKVFFKEKGVIYYDGPLGITADYSFTDKLLAIRTDKFSRFVKNRLQRNSKGL